MLGIQVRSHVEQQLSLVAKGQADKAAVVAHTLRQFQQKFLYFVAKIARMDALFEASFSPLASSGVQCHAYHSPCGKPAKPVTSAACMCCLMQKSG